MNWSDRDFLEKIIKLCSKGDRQSQQILYKEFYGKMLKVCVRYSTNVDEAKDVLHDGFIKIFEKIDRYDYRGSFEGWVRRIIANTAIDNLRKRRDFLSDYDITENLCEDDFIEEEKYKNISNEQVMKAIQCLSPSYKAVFNMYAFEGFSHKQIAEKLNISEGTSKSNLSKARVRLQEILKECMNKIEVEV